MIMPRYSYEVSVIHERHTYDASEVHVVEEADPKTRNGGMTERRKITPNPKTRNRGKSPIILKRGMAEKQP